MIGARLGPYEIVAPLGAGGMGEVYRAHDTRLGRDVAIKVLPADFAADAERLKRFEREAKATAALSHPNVIDIHNIGVHGGVPYLVEELLEGESLRVRLADGRIEAREASEIGVQIARGLTAAHERRIVHRDLKPENVFITTEGTVKILDFGLAKSVEPVLDPVADTITRAPTGASEPGRVLGTVAYMAPEQARGLAVDARADVFSLGVVLYEMLSGQRPFRGATATDVIAAILREDPEPLPGDAPPALALIVRRCLEKRPEDRFSSSHDLAIALGAVSVAATTAAGSAQRTSKVAGWLAGHRAAAAGMAASLMLIAVAVVALRWHDRPSRRDFVGLEPTRVAVAIFDNQTGDPSMRPVGRMAADWISQGLSRINGIEVVPSSLVFELARERTPGVPVMDPVRALADATGAGLVVSGTYYARGTALQLQARITDASSNMLLFAAEPASGDRKDPLGAVGSLRQQVVDAIAARYLDASYATWAAQSKPPRYQAYEEFLAGDEYFATDDRKTIAHLTRALELDPDFVLPRLGLVALYVNAGDYDQASQQLDVIEKSRGALTPVQRCRLDNLRAVVAGRFEEALASARDNVRLAPADILTNLALATSAIYTNRPRETVEVLTKPIHWELLLRPTRAIGSAYFWGLTGALHFLGEHERELVEAQRGRAIYPDLLNIRLCETRALVALGRLDEMDKAILETLTLPRKIGSPGGVMLGTASELRVHGHREESVRMATRAAEWFRARPGEEGQSEGNRSSVAECLYQAEQWQDAQAHFAALAKAHPESVNYKARLGSLAAHRGDRAVALRIAEELRRINQPYPRGRPAYYRATIAALLGNQDEAVVLLREALAQGVVIPALHTEMDLEPLRDYPPFEELVKPKG